MLKKIVFASVLMIASCAHEDPGYRYCPNVEILPQFSKLTRLYGDDVQYKVELAGYEGYCRYNPKTDQTVATIAPVFEIIRPSNLGSANVEIPYFADTSDNDVPLMKRQPHTYSTRVEEIGKKVLVTGKEIDVRIPNDTPGYKIDLGLSLSRRQFEYNRRQGLSD
ncbi:MAG: hypothetical protein IJ689_07010 [Alphaproteobacteria bacterium]|nr:hypothetical protein [Alphaproteobacteria bacterium]